MLLTTPTHRMLDSRTLFVPPTHPLYVRQQDAVDPANHLMLDSRMLLTTPTHLMLDSWKLFVPPTHPLYVRQQDAVDPAHPPYVRQQDAVDPAQLDVDLQAEVRQRLRSGLVDVLALDTLRRQAEQDVADTLHLRYTVQHHRHRRSGERWNTSTRCRHGREHDR